MKINKIFLVSLFVLAILTLGAVSASEDAELAVSDAGDDAIAQAPVEDVETASSGSDEVLADDAIEFNVDCPTQVRSGERLRVNMSINLPEEDIPSNTIYIYDDSIADEDYDGEKTTDEFWYSNTTSSSFYLGSYGTHNLRFVLSFNEGDYPDVTVTKKVLVEDYVISISNAYEDFYLGQNAFIEFSAGAGLCKTITVDVNNKKTYRIYYDEDIGYDMMEIVIDSEYLVYGQNNLTISYPGDSVNKAKTFHDSFYCQSDIIVPYSVVYGETGDVVLYLPDDATGKLVVSIDDVNQAPVGIKDGKAVFTLPVLEVGSYSIYAVYEGDDKYSIEESYSTFEVKPIVSIPELAGDAGANCVIEMSSKYNGEAIVYERTFDENYDYVETELARGSISNGKATIPFKISKDSEIYVEIECGDDYSFISDAKSVTYTTESPDWNMELDIRSIVNSTYQNPIYIQNAPYSFEDNSTFELYVDGIKAQFEMDYGYVRMDASDLKAGKHDFTLKFLGDGYFKATEVSGSFEVENMKVSMDNITYIDSYAEMTVTLPVTAQGTLKIKVDGKEVYTHMVTEDDIDYNEIYICADIEDLKYGMHDVEVLFDGNIGKFSQTLKINTTYDMSVSDVIRYGGDKLMIEMPTEISKGISISIDGVSQKIIVPDDVDRFFRFVKTTEDLAIGNHTVVLSYTGDSKYPKRTVEQTVEVKPIIELEESTSGDSISLVLPEDAKGNLEVYVKTAYDDDAEYKLVKSVKAAGKTSIDVSDLGIPYGRYGILVNYTGNDYACDNEVSEILTVNPEISYPEKMILDSDGIISFNLSGEDGRVEVTSDEFRYVDPFFNGNIIVPVNELSEGSHELIIYLYLNPYEDFPDDYKDTYYYSIKIDVVNPITAGNAAVVYSAGTLYKVQIKDENGNPIKGESVTFYLDNKKITTAKTDASGYASFKVTQTPKTYSVKATYKKISVTKKLTVKHVVTLKAATVKKSAKKLVLTATLSKVNGKYLKGKKITFKFNGKKYTAKTNKKGVAKVTVKKAVLSKLKVGKKIAYQATYLKDTVKKTVKVKK